MTSVGRAQARTPTRRQFVATAGAALAAAAAPGSVVTAQAPVLLPSWVADIDGDGAVALADRHLAESVLFAQRGFGLQPAYGFDPRADVFGRGAIDASSVNAIEHSVQLYSGGLRTRTRPITIAWHYGWYKSTNRPPALQTARFLGGNYVSWDPEIETTFNELKNEFGVTVDALSWIPSRDRDNHSNQENYRQGYLRAQNADTRYACLIYESTIANLRNSADPGERLDFRSPGVVDRLRDDFEQMARFLAEVRDDSPVRIFTLNNRPVVFIFGSHTWGPIPADMSVYGMMREDIRMLRERFRDIYGAYPYLVGDEVYLAPTRDFSRDRTLRSTNFDAIYVYHHAALKPSMEPRALPVTQRYIENQLTIMRVNYRTMRSVRNVFTGRRIMVIPNLSPGFAKPGFPTLQIGRGAYTDFLKLLRDVHLFEYIETEWHGELGTRHLPAAMYIVGSWNEEFEGHSIFPFDFNLTVPEPLQHGFDLSMAVKEAFGWNHYAERNMLSE